MGGFLRKNLAMPAAGRANASVPSLAVPIFDGESPVGSPPPPSPGQGFATSSGDRKRSAPAAALAQSIRGWGSNARAGDFWPSTVFGP